jgi:hypothetical protein
MVVFAVETHSAIGLTTLLLCFDAFSSLIPKLGASKTSCFFTKLFVTSSTLAFQGSSIKIGPCGSPSSHEWVSSSSKKLPCSSNACAFLLTPFEPTWTFFSTTTFCYKGNGGG